MCRRLFTTLPQGATVIGLQDRATKRVVRLEEIIANPRAFESAGELQLALQGAQGDSVRLSPVNVLGMFLEYLTKFVYFSSSGCCWRGEEGAACCRSCLAIRPSSSPFIVLLACISSPVYP